jgi:hypothetical protein
MLVATRRIELFDRYRVPYEIEDEGPGTVLRIRRADGGAELISVTGVEGDEQFHLIDGTPLFAALAAPSVVDASLPSSAGPWTHGTPVSDASGATVAHLRRSETGSICLPFDIDAPLRALLDERYLSTGSGGKRRAFARGAYYRLRPLIPRALQLALRRRFRRHQERATFPAWPIETALHRLESMLLQLVETVAGEPLPWIAPWPEPYDWALVLTHDVERKPGYDHVPAVRAAEARHALRSAWYFVPERDYRVESSLLDSLRGEQCEIGLHGLRHDGRDLSAGEWRRRLPAMRAYAERWGANGFRAPATHRDPVLLQQLGLDHDSSWADVARYEPQPGGSCSWLPFFIGDVVELPITLPMDHTLFELLREDAEEAWSSKTGYLKAHGGMALLLTHPDYLLDPERLAAYDGFMIEFGADRTAWHALPGEVADWWRLRAETTLAQSEGRWSPRGPGADRARVRLGAPVFS